MNDRSTFDIVLDIAMFALGMYLMHKLLSKLDDSDSEENGEYITTSTGRRLYLSIDSVVTADRQPVPIA